MGAHIRTLPLALLAQVAAQGCGGDRWCQSPEGPSQQCADDAGPPWEDDAETFPFHRYHDNTPATPLATGACVGCDNTVAPADFTCVDPLANACAAKGVKAAMLDGPIDCGGRGWFCRIYDQRGWVNPFYDDRNFAMCTTPNADEKDTDGHCHGSDSDDTYGWWIRDHWFRGYAGTLHCCCGWADTLPGVVNRCDFRKSVSPAQLNTCRDANEQHNDSYEDGCEEHEDLPSTDPLLSTPEQCWSVQSFADPEAVVGGHLLASC